MLSSCHIQSVEIDVEYWNFCWILNLCFLLIFSWKKWDQIFHFVAPSSYLRCLNSKEIKVQCSIRVIGTSFRSDFFQLKIRKKTKIENSTTISISTSISTLLIWHDPRIRIVFWFSIFCLNRIWENVCH